MLILESWLNGEKYWSNIAWITVPPSLSTYNGDLKQGQTWCANICYCAVYYKICRYNWSKWSEICHVRGNRDHYENQSTTHGNWNYRICKFYYSRITEEIAGHLHEHKDKGRSQEEFKQKKQGVNEDALEYFDTKLQLYLHTYDEGERNIQEFKG